MNEKPIHLHPLTESMVDQVKKCIEDASDETIKRLMTHLSSKHPDMDEAVLWDMFEYSLNKTSSQISKGI